MTAELGTYGIVLAFLAAMFGLMSAVAHSRLGSDRLIRAGRWALGFSAGGLTAALAAMTAAFLGDEFTIAYVAQYSERALPWGYKLAAVWAGREGSFLLWAWMMAVMAWVAAWTSRREPAGQQAATTGILSFACAAFAGMMLFGSNPFAQSEQVLADGFGLQPLLQHPAMVAHPPILFAGYAGLTIPMALLLGAVLAKRTDNRWVFRVRRWVLAGWMLLTVGIFLGSWWAYVVLGWGGYWGWDPVENGSLVPWLAATAAIHCLFIQQRCGMFRLSSTLLVSLSFLLCLTASYITRGGVIDSAHAFAPSPAGWFFLGLIAAGVVFTAVVIILRWRLLRSSPPLIRVASLEGGVLAANALLVLMAATILIGTFWALISSTFGPPQTLDKHFYNGVIIPMALVLMALMAIGPLLPPTTAKSFPRRRLVLGVIGAIHGLMISLLVMLPDTAWKTIEAHSLVLVAATIVGFAVFMIFDNVVRALLRPAFRKQGAPGVWRALRGNSRRFAGLATHAGMAMIVIGVAGSSLAGPGRDFKMRSGDSEKVGSYTLRLDSFGEVRGSHYTSVEAQMAVTEGSGGQFRLKPEKRFYDKAPKKPNTEVALRSGLGEDVYVILTGWEDGGATAVFHVLINPLVTWIWIGSIVMALATSLCLVHRAPRGAMLEETAADARTTGAAADETS